MVFSTMVLYLRIMVKIEVFTCQKTTTAAGLLEFSKTGGTDWLEASHGFPFSITLGQSWDLPPVNNGFFP